VERLRIGPTKWRRLLSIPVPIRRQSCDEPSGYRRGEDRSCVAGAEQGTDAGDQQEHEQADDLIPAEPCPQNDCGNRQTKYEVHGGAVSVYRHTPPAIGRGLSARLQDASDAVAILSSLHSIGGQGRAGVDAPVRPASEITPPLGEFKRIPRSFHMHLRHTAAALVAGASCEAGARFDQKQVRLQVV
jgi:hypothetical protein